jgi:protein TonB
VVLAAVLVAPAGASGAGTATGAGMDAKIAFEQLQERLQASSGATVSAACGSVAAPWAYRGKRGARMALRPYKSEKMNRPWAQTFVATLLRAADWDTIRKCRGENRPCDEKNESPLYVVSLRTTPETYVLVEFENACATVFEASRPLGAMHLTDRADTLFTQIRNALHEDLGVQLPPPQQLALDSIPRPIPALGDYVFVEELPEVTEKVSPKYPDAARARSVEGEVRVQALVGKDGAVHDAFVLQSIPQLDDAALDAVWDWKFKPARTNGKPIAVWVAIPVRFRLR